MGLPQRDQAHYTYGDYAKWGDETRYELIDGVAYAMAPAPVIDHQEIAGHIYHKLMTALEGQPCRPYMAPVDVRLPRHDEADDRVDTVLQPDVLVVCDPAKIDRRGVRGAPDLVVEVLSPSTAGRDQIHKRRVYERAGVREYWLVHPTDRVLTIYRLENGAYGRPDVQLLEGATAVGVLPGVEVAWDELIARLGPVED
jgi:Uma2 family endonuclease